MSALQTIDSLPAMLLTAGPVFPPTSSVQEGAEAVALLSGFEKSFRDIEEESYRIRDDARMNRQADTQTQQTYSRYLASYEKWWNHDQYCRVQRDQSHTVVPAFPILAGKVVLFLNYEMTREKYKRGSSGETKEGTNVGKQVIKSAISALESHRKLNQHLYFDVPGAQTKLRDDIRIRELEQAVTHNEPNRIKKSQTLKASGASADTYTPEELKALSLNCLSMPTAKKPLLVQIRDRAMVLLAASSAYRGDSLRPLEWSDLGMQQIPNTNAGFGKSITNNQALVLLSYNSKHNQEGRLDEHGVIRHRLPELCPIGALALHFFAQFHILDISRPSFEPDFSAVSQAAGFGTYGRREWYEYKVFYASDIRKPMSYDNHLERVKALHKANNIDLSKATHATRVYAAEISRSHGASADDTKALGGWNDKGSFKSCYDHKLPLPALLGAAMFNGSKPESHFLAREHLLPPDEVVLSLFPWVEEELEALQARRIDSNEAKDFALDHFLELLVYLRAVLVQDLALLFRKVPESRIFSYHPFTLPSFRTFAELAPARITHAEEEARAAFQNLPEQMAQTLRGVVENVNLTQQAHMQAIQEEFNSMREEFMRIGGTIGLLAEGTGPRKRARKSMHTIDSSMVMPLPPPPILATLAPSTSTPITSTLASQTFSPILQPDTIASPAPTITPSVTISITNSPGAVVTTSASPQSSSGLPDIPVSTSLKQDHPSSRAPLASLPNMKSSSAHVSSICSSPQPLPEHDPARLKWNTLLEKLPHAQVQKHRWLYKNDSWIPCYDLQPVRTFSDVWTEWAAGLNGHLPLRVLQEQFTKPAWHQSVHKVMNELGRRRKIIAVVETLAAKPQWSVSKALEFLADTYDKRFTPGTFSRHVAVKGGRNLDRVLAAAATYR